MAAVGLCLYADAHAVQTVAVQPTHHAVGQRSGHERHRLDPVGGRVDLGLHGGAVRSGLGRQRPVVETRRPGGGPPVPASRSVPACRPRSARPDRPASGYPAATARRAALPCRPRREQRRDRIAQAGQGQIGQERLALPGWHHYDSRWTRRPLGRPGRPRRVRRPRPPRLSMLTAPHRRQPGDKLGQSPLAAEVARRAPRPEYMQSRPQRLGQGSELLQRRGHRLAFASIDVAEIHHNHPRRLCLRVGE